MVIPFGHDYVNRHNAKCKFRQAQCATWDKHMQTSNKRMSKKWNNKCLVQLHRKKKKNQTEEEIKSELGFSLWEKEGNDLLMDRGNG